MGDAQAVLVLRVAHEWGKYPSQIMSEIPEYEVALMAAFLQLNDEAASHA